MSLGPMELIIILVIVLVLFGAGKLPRVMNDLGKGVRGMKEGLQGKDTPEEPKPLAKEEPRAIDHKTELKESSQQETSQPQSSDKSA